MMIKIDRLSIERKKEFRGNTRDLCKNGSACETFSRATIQTAGGGGGGGGGVVETAVVLQTGCTSSVGL